MATSTIKRDFKILSYSSTITATSNGDIVLPFNVTEVGILVIYPSQYYIVMGPPFDGKYTAAIVNRNGTGSSNMTTVPNAQINITLLYFEY